MSISHVFDIDAKTAQGRIMHFDVVLDKKISTNKVSDQLSQFTSMVQSFAIKNN